MAVPICLASVILLVIGVFALAPILVSSISPIWLLAILVVVASIPTSITVYKLYKYYEVKLPIWFWVPCVNELGLLNTPQVIGCMVSYGILILATIGTYLATYLPILVDLSTPYLVVSLVCLIAVQVFKGIGLSVTARVLYETKPLAPLKSAYSYALGFVPFARISAILVLSGALTSLLDFDGVTVSDEVSDEIIED